MKTEMDKLRWRCRRGMHELDVLLETWLEESYLRAPESQRRAFARLLDHPDPLLWAWLVLRQPCPDPELESLCRAIGKMP